jgi:hypothetical protein
MGTRILLPLLAVFWVVMNILLWRTEYGTGSIGAGSLSADLVLDRILTAPDPSTLRVFHQDQDIGIIRWIPTILEDRVWEGDEEPPEGMVRDPLGYRIEVDFTHHGEGAADRWRMVLTVDLDAEKVLQEAQFRMNQRPIVWELDASAARQSVVIRMTDGESTQFEQTFQVKDLQKLPTLLGTYSSFLPRKFRPDQGFKLDQLESAPIWSAHQERIQVGQHMVRVYRLNVQILGTYEVRLFVSRAGELFKVELPGRLTLTNMEIPKIR